MNKPKFDRVAVEIHLRNGDKNILKIWRGQFIDFRPGELLRACEASFADAVQRQSSVIEGAHPHCPSHD